MIKELGIIIAASLIGLAAVILISFLPLDIWFKGYLTGIIVTTAYSLIRELSK